MLKQLDDKILGRIAGGAGQPDVVQIDRSGFGALADHNPNFVIISGFGTPGGGITILSLKPSENAAVTLVPMT